VGVTSPSMSVVTRRSCRDFHNVGNNLRARLGVQDSVHLFLIKLESDLNTISQFPLQRDTQFNALLQEIKNETTQKLFTHYTRAQTQAAIERRTVVKERPGDWLLKFHVQKPLQEKLLLHNVIQVANRLRNDRSHMVRSSIAVKEKLLQVTGDSMEDIFASNTQLV